MVQSKKTSQKSDGTAVTDNGAVDPAQIKGIMIGVGILTMMNLIFSIAAVVLGLTVKSDLDEIKEDLSPVLDAVMEMAENVSNGPLPSSGN